MANIGHERLDLGSSFVRDRQQDSLLAGMAGVVRPTAVGSLVQLVMASNRVFGCASRTYQLHQLWTSATTRALSARR